MQQTTSEQTPLVCATTPVVAYCDGLFFGSSTDTDSAAWGSDYKLTANKGRNVAVTLQF